MCTAVTYKTNNHYFGRNLDYVHDFQESVTITPRNYVFHFRRLPPMERHFAMIGMAKISDGYPLYFDATNEHGLSAAALNFPHSAKYMEEASGKDNVAAFELIPWLLGDCKTVSDAEKKLKNASIVNLSFSPEYPVSPLHWMIADAGRAVTLEQTEAGLQIYENPVGVLTNEPPFPWHMTNLHHYLHLSTEEPENRFSPRLSLKAHSLGMGGIGLPGDLSSSSRFIKASFTKMNSVSKDAESASISQVFHILESVAQQQGCVKVGNLYEKTIYTSCCNCTKGIYYYTTYENSQITGVRLHGVDLESPVPLSYPLIHEQQVRITN